LLFPGVAQLIDHIGALDLSVSAQWFPRNAEQTFLDLHAILVGKDELYATARKIFHNTTSKHADL
jgi:hypothetical protein